VAEYRDDNTYAHTERVARTSFMLAGRLGYSDEQAAIMSHAAPLHDVGKLAVPDAILRKPGRLSPAEFELIKRHTGAGRAILAGSDFSVLRLGEEIASSHHEHWDGSGYPDGLRGDAIPLSGRIVALADVFDALTHVRCYKPAWEVEEAVGEIARLRARQFDPDVVEAFMALDPADLVELPEGWRPEPDPVAAGAPA
jgi:putative two-component system response regulator